MIELRAGANTDGARTVLGDFKRELSNITGTNHLPVDRLNAWRSWSAHAPARARAQFTDRSIRNVILGPQFTMLQNIAVSTYGPGLSALIDSELDTRLHEIASALQQIDDAVRFWGRDRIAIVLDTGLLLAAGPRVAQIAWDDVLNGITRTAAFVVPIQVVEELDRQKELRSGELRNKARYALKWLDEIVSTGNDPRPFPTGESDSTIRVWVDDNDRIPLAETDRDIIDRVLQLQPFTKQAVIASMDRSMVFRARTYGLTAALLDDEDIPPRSDRAQNE